MIGKQSRSPSKLNLNSQNTSPGVIGHVRPLPPDDTNNHSPDLQSPSESEDHSSLGGERLMWGPSRIFEVDEEKMGDVKRRSSGASLQWIMAPIEVPEIVDIPVEEIVAVAREDCIPVAKEEGSNGEVEHEGDDVGGGVQYNSIPEVVTVPSK